MEGKMEFKTSTEYVIYKQSLKTANHSFQMAIFKVESNRVMGELIILNYGTCKLNITKFI